MATQSYHGRQFFSGSESFEREQDLNAKLKAMLACTDGALESTDGSDLASAIGESLHVSPVAIMNAIKSAWFNGELGYAIGPPEDSSHLSGPLVRVSIIPPQEVHDA